MRWSSLNVAEPYVEGEFAPSPAQESTDYRRAAVESTDIAVVMNDYSWLLLELAPWSISQAQYWRRSDRPVAANHSLRHLKISHASSNTPFAHYDESHKRRLITTKGSRRLRWLPSHFLAIRCRVIDFNQYRYSGCNLACGLSSSYATCNHRGVGQAHFRKQPETLEQRT